MVDLDPAARTDPKEWCVCACVRVCVRVRCVRGGGRGGFVRTGCLMPVNSGIRESSWAMNLASTGAMSAKGGAGSSTRRGPKGQKSL